MRFLKLACLSLLVGLVVIPLAADAACGPRPDCGECLTEETCEVELMCEWDTDTCYDLELVGVEEGNVNSFLAYIGTVFSDAGLLLWVAIGVPLGFYVVRRVIGLLPKAR